MPRRLLFPIVALVLLVGCGDDSPTGPSQSPLVLACPTDVQALAHDGNLPEVFFSTTVVQPGTPPVTVTCNPGSGAQFPVGTTTVTCNARDARGTSASCSFRVIVSAVPRISAVTFLAFGDSLTEGTTAPDPTILRLNPPESYPYKLQQMLAERYLDQDVTVFNEGKAAETIAGAVVRLPEVLDARQPDVLLLWHGANNLFAAGRAGNPAAAIPTIINGLRTMVQTALARNVAVMLATYPPQDEDGSRGDGAPAIPALNEAIADLASQEGAVLVDLFEGLGGTPVGSIGADGLHPTADGYTKIAEIWFEAIQDEYEEAGAPAASRRPAFR